MTAPLTVPARSAFGKDRYDDAIDHELTSSTQDVHSALYVASQRDPQQHAKVLGLAQRTQLPSDVVARNYDRVAQQDRASSIYDRVLDDSPAVREWLRDPDNATIGQNELPALSRVASSTARLSPRTLSDGVLGLHLGDAAATGFADMGSAAWQLGLAFGLTSPEKAAREVANRNQLAQFNRDNAPSFVADYKASLEKHLGDTEKAFSDLFATRDQRRSAAVLGALTRLLSPMNHQGAAAVGDVLSLIGAATIAHPRGALYSAIEGAAPMLPMIGLATAGGAVGGSVVPGVGTAAGATAGAMAGTFAGMAPVNVGSDINQELAKRGIDITNPDALERAFRDPSLMSDIRGRAMRAGLTNAAVASLFSGFAGTLAEGAKLAGAGRLGVATGAAADVAGQAAGMGVAQAAGQVAAGERPNVRDALATAIQTLSVSAGMEAVGVSRRAMFGREPVDAAIDATQRASDAVHTIQSVQALSDLGAAVKDAPTTAGLPDRMKALVETASGASDATHVLFQRGDWDKYWTGRGESPAQKAADIMQDQGRGYADAQSTDAPLAIRLADYAAHVAPTEHFEQLLEHARTLPDGPTLHEAGEYLRDLPATMTAIAHEAADTPEAAAPDAAAPIGERIRGQLERAGVTPSAARAQAALFESGFRSLGQRTGVDPVALYDRYNVNVQRGRARDAILRANEAARAADEHLSALAQEEPEAAAKLQRARTEGGRLKNLKNATDDELANEYASLVDANTQENTAPSVIQNESRPGNVPFVGVKDAAAKAMGRVAARAKSIAKVEAELTRRGIEHADAYTRGYQNINNLDPTAFAFGENAFSQATPGGDIPRGQILFGDNGVTIDLLEKANRSTFLHETGHLYLRVLDDLAAPTDAPAAVKADYATIREWLGVKDGDKIGREAHEQFARGFEAYLMEGKAPSPALRGVFFRFREWLVGVYKDLTSLNVRLTPEVRRVFDRLLATDAEIAQAERESAAAPLFDNPKALGLSEAQATAYQEAVDEAHRGAVEEMTARTMRAIRLEESSEWATLREPIEAQTRAEIDGSPAYRALEYLRKGTNPDGSPLPEGVVPVKLDRDEVTRMIGKDASDTLPRAIFANDGVHPDVAAELLGFESGRDLVESLAGLPPRDQAIRSLTDQRMQLAHGERRTDQSVHDEALRVVQSEKRQALLRKELELLASDNLAAFKGLIRAVTKRVPPTEEIKSQARTIIGQKAVRDIRPDLHEKTATRLAKDARDALLRGDVDAAFDLKKKELLAVAVAQAAHDGRDVVDNALDEYKKMFRRDTTLAPARDLDYVNAAREILSTFGIGPHPEKDYLAQLRQYDPEQFEVIQAIVADAIGAKQTADYRDLLFGDFVQIDDAVRGLWAMSRRSRQIEIDGVKRDREAVVAELVQHLDEEASKATRPGERQAATRTERNVSALHSMVAALRRVEHWVRRADRGADDGPMRRYLWQPVSDAAVAFRAAKNAELSKFAETVDRLRPVMRHDKIRAPELDYTFDGDRELLGAMLHTGNESNLRKLLLGGRRSTTRSVVRPWGELTESGALDSSRWSGFVRRMIAEGRLTKAHYDFLQAVWDQFETLKPDAQRAHQELYGRYFDEVTANPFAISFGEVAPERVEYRGGYYPAKADPFMVAEQGRKQEATAVLESDNSRMFPTTGRGFTKSRVEYNRPLIIDANAVATHFDAVLRFVHLQPRVLDVARLIRDREFAAAVDHYDENAISEMLDPWLRRAAQQSIDTPTKGKAGRVIDRLARGLRRNAGMQILSVSLTTAAEQITHMPSVLTRVSKGAMARSLWTFMRSPREIVEDIHERSPYMATRESAGMMEVRRSIESIMVDPNVATRASAWLTEHGAFLTRAIQHVEDHITWQGAYDDALRGGAEEKAAVRHADATVREVLGGYEPESISRFEASTPVVKLFSMFYGFFNTKANFLHTELANAIRADVPVHEKAIRAASVVFYGFTVTAMLAHIIKQQLNGEKFDKDDDGPWDDALNLFFGSQLELAARMVPVAGPLGMMAVEHFHGGKSAAQVGDVISSPALKLLEASARAPADVKNMLEDRHAKRGQVTDLFTMLGMLTGTPLRPLARPAGFLLDGAQDATGPVDFTRGLLTGKAGER